MRDFSGRAFVAFALAPALACALTAAFQQAFAQTPAKAAACNEPAPEAITFVDVPGRPFTPIPTKDGCWIFVSLTAGTPGSPPGLILDLSFRAIVSALTGGTPRSPAGIAVLRRAGGKVSLTRAIPVDGYPTGMVLTHDGKLLIAAADDRLVFVDTGRMISGENGAVLGSLRGPEFHGDLHGFPVKTPGTVYVNVTSDDRFLFASDEYASRITVINLEKARSSGFKPDSIAGTIPTGGLPIAVTLSPDEKYLYTTSESAATEWGWPLECKPEGQDPVQAKPMFPQGAVVVVDVARAKTDPANCVIAKVPAGCSPVRLELSPRGETAYVTARNSNALLAFDTGKLVRDFEHALIGKVPVGPSPVGVAVFDEGKKVVVTNSNRFAGRPFDKQSLTVIDAMKVSNGPAAVLGTIRAGGFPRELRVTVDGRTLLVSNFSSNMLELVDLARLPLQSPPTSKTPHAQ